MTNRELIRDFFREMKWIVNSASGVENKQQIFVPFNGPDRRCDAAAGDHRRRHERFHLETKEIVT